MIGIAKCFLLQSSHRGVVFVCEASHFENNELRSQKCDDEKIILGILKKLYKRYKCQQISLLANVRARVFFQ